MKTLAIIALIIGLLFLGFQLYIYFNTAGTENQSYEVKKKENGIEIRFYPSVTIAQISSSAHSYRELSSSGFRKLAGYIFGGNENNTQIAMTTPVHMDINDTVSTMSFVMPADYESKTLPKPNDKNVLLTKTNEEYVAAIRFGGFANDESIKANTEKLQKLLDKAGIAYSGNFRYLGYNPPYQLIGRKNEVIVKVNWPSAD